MGHIQILVILELLASNRYESYLSNEILYILVSKEIAKIFEVKVGGHKENCQRGPSRTRCTRDRLNQQIFYRPPTLTFDIFAAS